MHLYFVLVIFSLSITLYGWNVVFAEGNEGLFLDPVASAVDSKGFVYVVDSYNSNTVQKFDSNGKFLSMWKTRNVDNNTMFDQPVGIAVDSSDNVYVVSSAHDKIKKLSDSGYIADSFGKHGYEDENGETLGGEFSRPLHIAIDSKDNIYVIDYGAEAVQKFSSDGTFILKWESKGTGDGQFDIPVGIAVDSSDNVYVLDEYSGIQKFSDKGDFLAKWGSRGNGDGGFLMASGITIDSSDIVYVVDYKGEFLQKFSTDGKFVEKIPIPSSVIHDDVHSGTTSVSIDDLTGNFYITNNIDKTVSKFSPNGTLLAKWGGQADWEASRQTESQDETMRVADNGVYNKKGLSLDMLEKNHDADIVFHLNPAMQENTIEAKVKYIILTLDDTIVEASEIIIISLDSPESKEPIVLPFPQLQEGSYFLKQKVEYVDDQDNTWSGSSGTRQIIVVDKFSKAINEEDGMCKKESFVHVPRPGFSGAVCVLPDTFYALSARWYN